jgi:hypothetical protein
MEFINSALWMATSTMPAFLAHVLDNAIRRASFAIAVTAIPACQLHPAGNVTMIRN